MAPSLITLSYRQIDNKAFMAATRKLYSGVMLPMAQARDLKNMLKAISREATKAGELYRDKVLPLAPKEGETPSAEFMKAFEEFMQLTFTINFTLLDPADFATVQFSAEELDAIEPMFVVEQLVTAAAAVEPLSK